MRLIRLIQKKTQKALTNNLINKFNIIFKAFLLSKKKDCNIDYVDIKFEKKTILANKNEVIRLLLDSTNLPKILEKGCFDSFIYKFLNKIKLKKSVFIDVGANHGFVSKQIRDIKNLKKVYAFEPNPVLFDMLKQNLSDVTSKIYNYGWGSKNSKFFLWCNKFNSGDFSLIKNKSRTQSIKCQINECNNEFEKIYLSNKKCNFIIKTDCQGYDVEIFTKLKERNLKKIKIYIMELNEIPENKQNIFFKKARLFDKFFICYDPVNQEKIKKIKFEDIRNNINKKKEFDLIMLRK